MEDMNVSFNIEGFLELTKNALDELSAARDAAFLACANMSDAKVRNKMMITLLENEDEYRNALKHYLYMRIINSLANSSSLPNIDDI